ncbi:unnamed protein product, partial [Mesorhabditis belari]|uniref:Uncharacterized protein n=1 Tax=Mesorhabditis belari TaxID=2138241 RepID=A0AAF3JBE0_9BILA
MSGGAPLENYVIEVKGTNSHQIGKKSKTVPRRSNGSIGEWIRKEERSTLSQFEPRNKKLELETPSDPTEFSHIQKTGNIVIDRGIRFKEFNAMPGGQDCGLVIPKNTCDLDWKPPEDDGGAGKSLTIYGDSDPLEADTSIVAKDPFDTAGKPGIPEITDWDKDRADLWAPPSDDGGAPVEQYLVEMRDGNGNWWEAAVVPRRSDNSLGERIERRTSISIPSESH